MSGYLLLDQPNPNGPHYYTTRNRPLLAIVVHVTAGLEDLDTVDDHSAEATAQYAATTGTEVSWHSGSDTDSWIDLLPAGFTAWHATAYNSTTYGHEISKKHTDWRSMPTEWVRKTLGFAAAGLRVKALANGIPMRKATRAELDREIANYNAGRPWQPVGFISHAELQSDRTDPGFVSGLDTFPWNDFFALMGELSMYDNEIVSTYKALFRRALTEGNNLGELERITTDVETIKGQVAWMAETLGNTPDKGALSLAEHRQKLEDLLEQIATKVGVEVKA